MRTIEQLMLDDTAASTGVRDNLFYHMLGAERLSAASLCTLAGMTGVQVFADYLGEYREPGLLHDVVDVTLNFEPDKDRGLYTVELFGLGIWDENTALHYRWAAERNQEKYIERLRETVYLDFRVRRVTFCEHLQFDKQQPTAEKLKAITMVASRFNAVDSAYAAIFKELN